MGTMVGLVLMVSSLRMEDVDKGSCVYPGQEMNARHNLQPETAAGQCKKFSIINTLKALRPGDRAPSSLTPY